MIEDMTADELRHIARKLKTYAGIYTGDKEARSMAVRCEEIAGLLEAAAPASTDGQPTTNRDCRDNAKTMS